MNHVSCAKTLIRMASLGKAAMLWLVVSGGIAAAQPYGRGLPTPEGDAGGRLWITTLPLDDVRHVLVVVDTAQKQVAIYHVDAATGTLTLKSSRDISADLQVGDFNAQEPKPAALRKMLEMKATPPPGR